ncbi:unnamed protein product [Onchocerca flexuosa]|uniref:CUB domain-containing protein n=1 Tax=Onchocerca flexuosa TaxID=387005 RepID=A0A183H6D0_9BILA|nr:unnamed protein product [Onchocerca flexuosa]
MIFYTVARNFDGTMVGLSACSPSYSLIQFQFFEPLESLAGSPKSFHFPNVDGTVAQPIILQAKSNTLPVYFHTIGYETGRYANNMRCSWMLMGSNSRKRIMLTVHDSNIDDALFSECDDYCSIHDGKSFLVRIVMFQKPKEKGKKACGLLKCSLFFAGNTSKAVEVVRWCGEKHPDAIISTTNSLYVYFHSDEAFQGRGINMSFTEFDMPGCPPSWTSSPVGYCYILKKPTHGLTWLEAQKECSLERSNLLTLTSADEYSSVAAIYAKSKTLPWIGYMDYSSEDKFMPVDPNSGPWPEDLPKLTGSPSGQKCVYVDWRNREGDILAVDDCRNRHEYICKRRQDGTTIPYLAQEVILSDLAKSSISFTIWLFIILLVLLTLILFYLCYRKCRKQHALSRIGSSDINQRLVTGIDMQRTATSAVIPHIGSSEIQKTGNVAINSDGAKSGATLITATENPCNSVMEGGSSRLVVRNHWKSNFFLVVNNQVVFSSPKLKTNNYC